MEVKNIIGTMKCSISFEPTWNLIEDSHEDAYIRAFQYLTLIIRPLNETNIKILSKKEIKFNNLKSTKVSKLFSTDFSYTLKIEDLSDIKNIILPIYYSNNSDVLIELGINSSIIIASDPIDIVLKYKARA